MSDLVAAAARYISGWERAEGGGGRGGAGRGWLC